MIVEHHTYNTILGKLHYHSYAYLNPASNRRLLLLHGSRLGGLDTWNNILGKLDSCWSHVLVPDLPGIGKLNPQNLGAYDFTLSDILDVIIQLVEQHDWENFDIASYSFGGVISAFLSSKIPTKINRQLLIEPSMLNASHTYYHIIANKLQKIAEMISVDPQKGNAAFSRLITLQQRRFALQANTRPIENPLGFANILQILAKIYRDGKIINLLQSQPKTTLIATEYMRNEAKIMVNYISNNLKWKVYFIPNADHSVIFSQTEIITTLLKKWSSQILPEKDDIYG